MREPEPWWRQANADLDLAEYCFEGAHWYGVSWFAQQAVEKGLKALFVKTHHVLPPQSHVLPALGRAVFAPRWVLDDLEFLNPSLRRGALS